MLANKNRLIEFDELMKTAAEAGVVIIVNWSMGATKKPTSLQDLGHR